MQINLKLLKTLDACQNQVDKFVKIYGDSDAPLTIAEAIKHYDIFDFDWLARKVLNAENYKSFLVLRARAQVKYIELKEPHLQIYEKNIKPVSEHYNKTRSEISELYGDAIILDIDKNALRAKLILSNLDTYTKIKELYWISYQNDIKYFWINHKKYIASMFANLYLKQNELK